MSTLYTQEQLNYIAEARKTMTAKQIATQFNARFGTNKNAKAIQVTCKRYGWKSSTDGRFEKGCQPWNADTKGRGLTCANITSFKKGNTPACHRPVGSERIDSKEGYLYIKVSEPNTWKQKHIVLWESINGPVPPGHIVRFIDGDITNIEPENIELSSRQELLQYNINGLNKADQELKPLIRMISKINVKLFEKTASSCHG